MAKKNWSIVTFMMALEAWLEDGRLQNHSEKTLKDRRELMHRVIWWLENKGGWGTGGSLKNSPVDFSTNLIKRFLAYSREPNSEGRYGSDRPSARREASDSTVNRYFREIRTFMNYCVSEGHISVSPIEGMKAPSLPKEQPQPFTNSELEALFHAAKQSTLALRDQAILMLLYDTGLRVSELCSLHICDVLKKDLITVKGKGGYVRDIAFGKTARTYIQKYLNACRKESNPSDPLFHSVKSENGLTPCGVRQMIDRLNQQAGIVGKRVSPHIMRHTFAVQYLRNGANVFATQKELGHKDLTMARRYVKLADTDLIETHKKASPGDGFFRRENSSRSN